MTSSDVYSYTVFISVWQNRRGGQWITCRSHASIQGYGNVSVSVFVDKAHIHKDLKFEYVEDPTVTKLEPEWSIFRCVYYKAS